MDVRSNPELGRDVMDVFKHLTGLHKQKAVGGYRQLLVAHAYMKRQLISKIDREIANASQGKQAGILLKVNGLDDPALCAKLYEASRAGVRIDAIVRGVCRLRPGVAGLSDNIRVVSVIGRFLEHHRVSIFFNGGTPEVFIGSADWMARNLDRRVEVSACVRACVRVLVFVIDRWDVPLSDTLALRAGCDADLRRGLEDGSPDGAVVFPSGRCGGVGARTRWAVREGAGARRGLAQQPHLGGRVDAVDGNGARDRGAGCADQNVRGQNLQGSLACFKPRLS